MAAGLSLLLLGLQLLGLGHLALERHGVCWEHGTLTEARPSEAHALLAPVAPVAPGLHARATSSALQDRDAHHHCPVQASRRHWGAPPAGAALPLEAVGDPGALLLLAAWQRVDGALLLRAPKQSPPLAA